MARHPVVRNRRKLPRVYGGEPGPTDALASYTTEQLEDMNAAFVGRLIGAIRDGRESAEAISATVRTATKRR